MLFPFEITGRGIVPLLRRLKLSRLAPLAFRAARAARLGTLHREPDQKTNPRTRALWDEAIRRGIQLTEFRPFGFAKDLFAGKYRGARIVFQGLPRPHGARTDGIEWMDHKGKLRERCAQASIPIARGAVCGTLAHALHTFREIGGAAITKPVTGSRSRHTTIHIATEPELAAGFWKAKQLSPWVVVEEELRGFVHRATVIGGKLVAVVRREPPHVVGDGKRTVRELVKRENQNPARRGPVFHEIATGPEANAELARQNLAWTDVPPKNLIIALSQKTSRGIGGSTTELTNETHQENIKLFERVAALVNDPLVGIDFIIGDISRPWREQLPAGVIECNSLPFIDLHHHPLRGKPVNAAAALWDIVLPETAR